MDVPRGYLACCLVGHEKWMGISRNLGNETPSVEKIYRGLGGRGVRVPSQRRPQCPWTWSYDHLAATAQGGPASRDVMVPDIDRPASHSLFSLQVATWTFHTLASNPQSNLRAG